MRINVLPQHRRMQKKILLLNLHLALMAKINVKEIPKFGYIVNAAKSNALVVFHLIRRESNYFALIILPPIWKIYKLHDVMVNFQENGLENIVETFSLIVGIRTIFKVTV